MKLRYKVFSVVGLVWIPFLILAYVSAEKSHLLGYIAVSVLFSAIVVWLVNSYVFNRIKKITHEVDQIQTKKTLSQRIYLQGDDELSKIASQINTLLDVIRL